MKIATYHGLIKATCVSCGWVTQDPAEIEILNDIESTCSKCESENISYTTVSGSTIEGGK